MWHHLTSFFSLSDNPCFTMTNFLLEDYHSQPSFSNHTKFRQNTSYFPRGSWRFHFKIAVWQNPTFLVLLRPIITQMITTVSQTSWITPNSYKRSWTISQDLFKFLTLKLVHDVIQFHRLFDHSDIRCFVIANF